MKISEKTAFITCVESGLLEKSVMLLVESIRSLPGEISKFPIYAIQPRADNSLSQKTVKFFREKGVIAINKNLIEKHSWYSNINKSAAMSWAETNLDHEYLTWIDADIVFLRPPTNEILLPSAGFSARAGEASLGTNGKDNNTNYWLKLYEITGVNFREFNIIESLPENKLIFEYFQSGIYTVKRNLGVSQKHFHYFKQVLDTKISSVTCGTYHYDQACLSLAAVATASKRDLYPWEMNYNLNVLNLDRASRDMIARCYCLHYHGSFYGENFAKVLPYLDVLPPEKREMILAHAPMTLDMPLIPRLRRKLRSTLRNRQKAAHAAACTAY